MNLYILILGLLIIFSNVLNPVQSEKSEHSFHIGKVEWSEKCHPLIFNEGMVRVIDSDIDVDPHAVDTVEIEVQSDFNAREQYANKTIPFILQETGNSTGIFESIVFWGNPWDDSLGHRIPIWNNTTVTAKYVDYTLPEHISGLNMDILDSLIVKDVKPLYENVLDESSVGYYLYEPCSINLASKKYDTHHTVEFIFPPPLQQLKTGLEINELQCKEGLELIFKSSDGSPACVKPETKTKLIERGWAKPT